jgi:hypothetical protein
MGMWTTENQDTLKAVLKAFSEASRTRYDTWAYEAGYLESVIVSVLPDMPKRKQRQLIADLHEVTAKLQTENLVRAEQALGLNNPSL